MTTMTQFTDHLRGYLATPGHSPVFTLTSPQGVQLKVRLTQTSFGKRLDVFEGSLGSNVVESFNARDLDAFTTKYRRWTPPAPPPEVEDTPNPGPPEFEGDDDDGQFNDGDGGFTVSPWAIAAPAAVLVAGSFLWMWLRR